MLFIVISSPAQTGVSTIRKYGDYLKGWMEEGNHEQREKITKMCEGNIKTRVDDQLLKEFLRLSNKTLAEGDKMMDTYLNGFESLNGKTKILFSNIRVLSEEEVPHIKIGKEKPKQYVTADITLDNKNLKFFGSDLFWVRGKMITNILDNSDDISIGKAIRLYAMKRYEEAFRMFRTLAYQDVFNYEAQYYTAVMELKNQGCSFLAPEVRDAECLWLCTKSFVVSNQSESCKNMNSLFLRFTMDERKNVYFGMDRYKWTFLFYKLINRVSSLKFQFLVQKRHDTSFKVLIIISLQHIMISWISKTFSSVKITPENNAISIDNQQIKLLNPYQKREHRTGHPN